MTPILAIPIFISFVTTHLKEFGVAASNSNAAAIRDTDGIEIVPDTQYYILSVFSGMDTSRGLTFNTNAPNDYVFMTKDEHHLGIPVTFSFWYCKKSNLMLIQSDPNYKWTIYHHDQGPFVIASKVAEEIPGLFSIKKVAGQYLEANNYYQICFNNFTLGVDVEHKVLVVGKGTPLEFQFLHKVG